MALALCFGTQVASAQSTMSDQQVLDYAKNGLASGKSQKQVATELAARGVTRAQAERVKDLYERQQGNAVTVHASNTEATSSRAHVVSGNENSAEEVDPLSTPDSGTELKTVETSDAIFGRGLFSGGSLNFAPSENMATPLNYTLGPGDEVIIDLFGHNQTTLRQTISPEGNITVDVLGPIYLNGMTLEQANSFLKKKLAAIYAGLNRKGSTDIRLTLGRIRTIQVNIMGEVAHPGTYNISSLSTLFHALYRAGGIVGNGTMRNIIVTRNGRTIAHSDLYEFIMNGTRNGDVSLKEGDVIMVKPYSIMVNLKGKVKRPMKFELKEGETLKTLINYAAGFAQGAYTKNITVVRQNGRQYEVCSVDEFDFSSFRMQDGDEIEVGELLSRFENRIKVEGAVYKAGMYQLGNVTTVRGLVEKADGLLPEAFTSRAVLHRERPDRSLEVLSVDLKGILDGTSPDVALRNNDVLYIPSIYDLKELGSVTISGEVIKPGTFPYADNTTIEDLIILAGGLTRAASLARVDVSRRIIDPKSKKSSKKLMETFSFSVKDGFVIDGQQGFVLQPYDIVTVRRSPGYQEPQYASISGEANFQGSFPMEEKGMRLSQLVEMAGGLTDDAWVKGARLVRTMTGSERQRLLEAAEAMEAAAKRDSVDYSTLNLGNTYYIGIDLDKALANPGSDHDVVLRNGDRLEVPLYSNVVSIAGAVIQPNTVTYDSHKKAGWYIENAGGFSDTARKRHIYAMEMNGHIRKLKKSSKVNPGSQILVPRKGKRHTNLANILGIATTSASMATMLGTLYNIIKK